MGSFFCDDATIEDDDLVGVFYVSHAVGDYQDGDAWLSFSYWSLSGKLPDVNSKEPENTAEYSAPQILPPTMHRYCCGMPDGYLPVQAPVTDPAPQTLQ